MKNNNETGISINGIILMTVFILYSLIVFTFVKYLNIFFWCSFTLTTMVFLCQIVINEYLNARHAGVKKSVFMFLLSNMGTGFMIFQIIFVILSCRIQKLDYSIMSFILIAAFVLYYVVIFISLRQGLEKRTEDNTKTTYIGFLTDTLRTIENNVNDFNSRIIIHQFYEKVMNNNIRSTKEAYDIELEIKDKIVEFKKVSSDCDNDEVRQHIREINFLFDERNRICMRRNN
ncbi:MAG: hypothetical protein K6G26_09830 [Lachnospiraceae bacterium]|nr:hypothetical protein [Lachnospiraceae bacterium]